MDILVGGLISGGLFIGMVAGGYYLGSLVGIFPPIR